MEVIETKTREEWLALRAKDVTSTEVAALFGVSPYITEFELWHKKKSSFIVELEEHERMLWGIRLQSAIANGIAEDKGWTIRPMTEYIRDPKLRLGASFDFEIMSVPSGILEIKNVDSLQFHRTWELSQEKEEIPLHIEFQVQTQLGVSERSFAEIGALVGGNNVQLAHRDPAASIISGIKNKVEAFWGSVEANRPPAPNLQRDVEFISKLYGFAEPGKILDAADDKQIGQLCVDYRALADHIKSLEEKKDSIKAMLLMRINDAEKVLGPDYTISAGMIGPCQVAYERKGYRNFRITWRKEKKK